MSKLLIKLSLGFCLLVLTGAAVAQDSIEDISVTEHKSTKSLLNEFLNKRDSIDAVRYDVQISTETKLPTGEFISETAKQTHWVTAKYVKLWMDEMYASGQPLIELIDRKTGNTYEFQPKRDIYIYRSQNSPSRLEFPGATGPNWLSNEEAEPRIIGVEILDGKETTVFEDTSGIAKFWVWNDTGIVIRWESSIEASGLKFVTECKNFSFGEGAMFEVSKEKIFGDEPQEMEQLMQEERNKAMGASDDVNKE